VKPILSVRDLASRLGTSVTRLREIAGDIDSHYSLWTRWDEKKQKVRHFRVPKPELMEIQRRIKNKILSSIPLSDGVHGGVRGGSPRSNASPHLGQPCVINLDVRDFFGKVRHYMVHRMFVGELRFGRDVARLLTRLTTLNGELPQGAPTSTAVANLLLAVPVDGPMLVEAERLGHRYSRFVDDITLSGDNPRPLINTVARALSRRRLPMYRKKAKKPKLKITPISRRQEVTGLTVNSTKGPSVPRRTRGNIRAAIFRLHAVPENAFRTAVSSVRGRIAYARQFNPGSAERMRRTLESLLASRS